MKSWCFDFSPNDKLLAYGLYDINLFDLESHKKQFLNLDGNCYYCMIFLDNDNIAVGNKNGTVSIYSTDYLKRKFKIEGKFIFIHFSIYKIIEHCKTIRSLAYDSTNKLLIIHSDDLHITVYDLANNKVRFTWVGHKDLITCSKYCQNTKVLITGSLDGFLKIWDIHNTNNELDSIDLGKEILDLSVSPDEREIVVGTKSGYQLLVKK